MKYEFYESWWAPHAPHSLAFWLVSTPVSNYLALLIVNSNLFSKRAEKQMPVIASSRRRYLEDRGKQQKTVEVEVKVEATGLLSRWQLVRETVKLCISWNTNTNTNNTQLKYFQFQFQFQFQLAAKSFCFGFCDLSDPNKIPLIKIMVQTITIGIRKKGKMLVNNCLSRFHFCPNNSYGILVHGITFWVCPCCVLKEKTQS